MASLASPAPQDEVPRILHLFCFGLCVVNIAWLVAMYAGGSFFIDSVGRAKPTDFVNVWAAGRLVLDGQAAAAYDWATHEQVQNTAVGFDFPGHYGWHYPPHFLFVAAALAAVPYLPAFAVWMALTLPLYLVTVRAIVGQPFGWLFAAGFPAVLANFAVGQNGFLTASLIGGALGFMRDRPVLAGVCLGLLTYKPQFGVLFPVVLIAARQWTVFGAAAGTATVLVLVSWLAFGGDVWAAFFDWLPATSQTFLSEGRADISKQQSLFALARTLGGAEALAWSLQAALALATAAVLCVLWRGDGPFEAKAAALAAGSLLATPYVYLYDVVVLAVAVAFLLRLCISTGFRRHELPLLGIAAVLIVSFTFVRGPFALGAIVLVMMLALLRGFPNARSGGSPAASLRTG